MLHRVHALYARQLAAAPALPSMDVERALLARRCEEQLSGRPVPDLACTLEYWLRSLEAAQDLAARLRADTRPVSVLLSREFLLFERADAPAIGRAEAIKGKFLFRRRAGLSLQAFRDYWRGRHGPIVLRTPEILRYVQSHVLPVDTGDSPPYDGVTELYWFDHAAAVRSMQSREITEEQSADAANFVDGDSLQIILLREERVG